MPQLPSPYVPNYRQHEFEPSQISGLQRQLGTKFLPAIPADVPDQIPNIIEEIQSKLAASQLDDLAGALQRRAALRIRYAHFGERLNSLSNSRTRLLPHQVAVAHKVAQSPRPGFILADEVGLGKTIEAGLAAKELMLRHDWQKVLVVCPASLCRQWQAEMAGKFNEDFMIVDGPLRARHGAAIWDRHQKIIVSLDFAKNEAVRDEIVGRAWDIAIFDEAHRLRRDENKITRAWAFAAKLAAQSKAVLCLSATPFRGKLAELYYLIALVDPDLFASHGQFLELFYGADAAAARGRISQVLLRHRKIEVGGFTKRFAKTVQVEFTPAEREFYDATTAYVREEYDLALRESSPAKGFVMIVYQRLLDSSSPALAGALRRRLEKLCQRTGISGRGGYFDEGFESDFFESEGPEPSLEERNSFEDARREILRLRRLLELAAKIKRDKKLEMLAATLRTLKARGEKKFLIFTEFRGTQDYLAENLSDFSVTLFHGGLSAAEKERAVADFRDRAEILICTESGGEGRNLQWANILVNYDLPWSPLKIEQRIGRLHRFGQTRDVHIINFATKDTVAERVLEVLQNKIRLFEDAIGESDALLGALEDELDFNSTFARFIGGKKSRREVEAEIEKAAQLARANFAKLGELVAPQAVDFNLEDFYRLTRHERAIDNEDIENFARSFYRTNAEWTLAPLPAKSARASSIFRVSRLGGSERLATFNAETALSDDALEFLACGHALVDNALNACSGDKSDFKLFFGEIRGEFPPAARRSKSWILAAQFLVFDPLSGSPVPLERAVDLTSLKPCSDFPEIGSAGTIPEFRSWPTSKLPAGWPNALARLAQATLSEDWTRGSSGRHGVAAARCKLEAAYQYRISEVEQKLDRLRAAGSRGEFAAGDESQGAQLHRARLEKKKLALYRERDLKLAELSANPAMPRIELGAVFIYRYY